MNINMIWNIMKFMAPIFGYFIRNELTLEYSF